MKFTLRTCLLLIAIVAILLPAGVFLTRINLQPEMSFSRSFQNADIPFEYFFSNDPESEAIPYINCLTVHERDWGQPRIIVMHRITEPQFRNDGRFPDWLEDDGYMPVRVNGQRIYAGESTVVIFAENAGDPLITQIENKKIPLQEPWWPDTAKLWELIQTINNAG